MCRVTSADNSMTMEVGAEAQQGADTAVAEAEAQQITQAQIATLTQVTMSSGPCDDMIILLFVYFFTVSGCGSE